MTKQIEGDPKQPHPMDPVRLAATAYHALIEQAFVIQQRMVMREATKAMFGPNAIPLIHAFRSGRDVLTCSGAHMRREEEHDRESLEEVLAQIKEMEPIFKGHGEHPPVRPGDDAPLRGREAARVTISRCLATEWGRTAPPFRFGHEPLEGE